MTNKLLITGLILLLSTGIYAAEQEAETEEKLALIQLCTESADDIGLEGDERTIFIEDCTKKYTEKSVSEEG